MRVRVYYNLHKHQWSVQGYTPGKGWRIIYHNVEMALENVTWKVSAAGQRRVRLNKRKNVHAFAIGTLATNVTPTTPKREDCQPVRYNPYEMDTFQVDGRPITQSDYAYFTWDRRVLACNSR